MINAITNVLAWIVKNTSLLIGIIEAILKLAKGIVAITPNKKDDAIIAKIESYSIADKLERVADFLAKYTK